MTSIVRGIHKPRKLVAGLREAWVPRLRCTCRISSPARQTHPCFYAHRHTDNRRSKLILPSRYTVRKIGSPRIWGVRTSWPILSRRRMLELAHDKAANFLHRCFDGNYHDLRWIEFNPPAS